MSKMKETDNVKLDKDILDEYLHYKEGEVIRQISEDEYRINEEAENCPYGFEISEAPGCASYWNFQIFGESCLFCPFADNYEN